MAKLSINHQRTLCLVPFPFSDQSGQKVRPVIILSNNLYNQSTHDVIVAGITSNPNRENRFEITQTSLEMGHLVKTSYVMFDNILRIAKKLIIKPFAVLNEDAYQNLRKNIFTLFE